MRLPRLSKFAGEQVDTEEPLEQFIREFERHAQLAKWTGEDKRLQFEVHLTGRVKTTNSQDAMPVPPVVHVRLIQATRLPGRHAKLVKAQIDRVREKAFALFESARVSGWRMGLLSQTTTDASRCYP